MKMARSERNAKGCAQKYEVAMKLRESGMPDETYWESLFDVPLILDRLGIDGRLGDVIELGCGYGTFTIPVARRIAGTVHAFDIDPVMIARTRERAAQAGVRNIVLIQRDVLADGFGLGDDTAGGCLLFNILHGEEPVRLLCEAARVTHRQGRVYVIHWRYDSRTPRGPSMDIRPRPEQVLAWASQASLAAMDRSPIDLPPWHYGLRFRRTDAASIGTRPTQTR